MGITKAVITPYSVVIKEEVYPHANKTLVRIIGSKKYPIVPIILVVVVGIEILKTLRK